MNKRYLVSLTSEERQALKKLVSQGRGPARVVEYARVLLKADVADDSTDEEISQALDVSVRTIERVRRRFVEEGLGNALRPPKVPRPPRKLDGEVEAHLVALACSDPPSGRGRWTVRLLAQKMVEMGHVESISHESVRTVLKKNELKPWQKKCWCIPPYGSGEFVCQMEEVLELYKTPYDLAHPLVCLDETSKQLISETRAPLKRRPRCVDRYDVVYKREGVRQLFIMFEPLRGWRHVVIRLQKAAVDWAEVIEELLEVHYPSADRVRLVMDNLNTHAGGSLYQAFPPPRARQLYKRLEIHYTPKHGSWLDMAEIELSVLMGQCLNRRLGTDQELSHEVAAWERSRNRAASKIDWRFTSQDARIKLRKLYPTIKIATNKHLGD